MANLIRYADGDIVVSTDKLTTSTWSGNTNNLQSAHTASTVSYASSTASGQFFLDVFVISSIFPMKSSSSNVIVGDTY